MAVSFLELCKIEPSPKGNVKAKTDKILLKLHGELSQIMSKKN